MRTLAFLLFVLLLMCCSCTRPPARTWDAVCEQIKDQSSDVRVAPEAVDKIRDQVTASFNQYYVDEAKKNSTLKTEDTDKVANELVRLQLLGAWREGSHLHLADFYLFRLDEEDKPLERWRDHLKARLFSDQMPCLGGTVKLLFDDITLHQGSDETLVFEVR